APANFIGEHAQVFLQGSGRLEGLLHHSIIGLRKAGQNTGQQQRRDEESNSGFAHGEGNYTQGRLPLVGNVERSTCSINNRRSLVIRRFINIYTRPIRTPIPVAPRDYPLRPEDRACLVDRSWLKLG